MDLVQQKLVLDIGFNPLGLEVWSSIHGFVHLVLQIKFNLRILKLYPDIIRFMERIFQPTD